MADSRKDKAGRDSWEPGIRHAFRKARILGTRESPDSAGVSAPATRYELHDELARDSASVLLRARDREVDRDVTLRVLGGDGNGDETAVCRFLEEAQVGAQLQHPGILPVYGLGILEDGRAYVASQIVEGQTLAQLEEGEEERRLAILEVSAHALAYAHARGVAHGTLDATRIHVGAHGEVVISGWERAVRASWDAHRIDADVRALLDLLGTVLGNTTNGNLKSAGAVARAIGDHLEGREVRVREAEISAATARVEAELERARALRTERQAMKERAARRRTLTLAAAVLLAILLCLGGLLWREEEEAAEQDRIVAQIAAALREAKRCEAAGEWPEAVAWASEAAAMAEEADRDAAVRARDVLARAERRSQMQAEDVALLSRLEEIRTAVLWWEPHAAEINYRKQVSEYEAAFRESGLDLLHLELEAGAAAIRSRTIVREIAAAAHTWGCLTSWAHPDRRREGIRLTEMACLADPDPWTCSFRRGTDTEELRRLALTADLGVLTPWAIWAVGATLVDRGELDQAVEILREARRRRPEDIMLASHAAWATTDNFGCRSSRNRAQGALHHCAAVLALRPEDARLWTTLLKCLSDAGERGQALALAASRRAVELAPGRAMYRLNLSGTLLEHGKVDEAIRISRSSVLLFPEAWQSHRGLAAALEVTGRLDEALLSARKAVSLDPANPELHHKLGHMLNRSGDQDGALRALREAVRLDPTSAVLQVCLGTLVWRNGDQPEAHALWESAYRLAPDKANIVAARCSLHLARGEMEKAVEVARNATTLRPDSAIAHLYLGATLHTAGQEREALDAYRRSADLDPHLLEAEWSLGALLMDLGRPEEALAPLTRATQLEPDSRALLLGIDFSRTGSPGYSASARRRFKAIVQAGLGEAQMISGNLDAALAACAKAAKLDPGWPETHYTLARVLKAQGRIEELIQTLRRAVELFGEDEPELLNCLAWWLVNASAASLRDPEVAVELAERAVRVAPAPRRANYRAMLGQALYRAGRFEEATQALEESLRLDPGTDTNPHNDIFLFLAMAHFRLGQPEAAREWFRKGIRWVEMEADPSGKEMLARFRAEAEALLGVVRPGNVK